MVVKSRKVGKLAKSKGLEIYSEIPIASTENVIFKEIRMSKRTGGKGIIIIRIIPKITKPTSISLMLNLPIL